LTRLQQAGVFFVSDSSSTLPQFDLEPEYVSITGDMAYITAQENNAVIHVNLTTKTIKGIYAAGIKDWDRGLASATNHPFTSLAYPGNAPDENKNGMVDNGEVVAGGLSGLYYDKTENISGVELDVFYTISDRGPQALNIGDRAKDDPKDPGFGEKVFEDPQYPITVYKIGYSGKDGTVKELGSTALNVPATATTFRPSTGIGYLQSHDKAYKNNGNNTYTLLDRDPFGLDSESLALLTLKGVNGDRPVFVVTDEYGPQVAMFDSITGNLVQRFVPKGTDFPAATAATAELKTSKTLPAFLLNRRANRGFEAAAYNSDDNLLYCFIQSTIRPGGKASLSTIRRIVAVDLLTGEAKAEYMYLPTGPSSQVPP
jgi:hypothetical protein